MHFLLAKFLAAALMQPECNRICSPVGADIVSAVPPASLNSTVSGRPAIAESLVRSPAYVPQPIIGCQPSRLEPPASKRSARYLDVAFVSRGQQQFMMEGIEFERPLLSLVS